MKYQAHSSTLGWLDWKRDFEVAGTTGLGLGLEAIIVDTNDIPDLGIQVHVHVATKGWLPPVGSGQVAGTTGEGLPIEAMKIELAGNAAANYDIYYRLHVADYGWLLWAKNGEFTGSTGGGVRAEAVQIALVEKDTVNLTIDTTQQFMDLTPVAPPAPAPTVSQRESVIASAESYVGYGEGADDTTIFGANYGVPTAEWCMAFVLFNLDLCGAGGLILHDLYVPNVVNWLIASDTQYFYSRRNHNPERGDIIFFDYNGNGTPDHVGFVTGNDGTLVHTCEGNSGSPAMVRRKTYYLDDEDILGYGVLTYAS